MKIIEKTISLSEIKTLINENIGKKVCIYVKNKQGKKLKEYIGDIVDTYTALFVLKIKINSSFINKSFSYVDFLTNELSIDIL